MNGMIQKVDASVPTAATPISDAQNGTLDAPTWFHDEGIAGTGARPEWLEAKYNKVSDQARAYKEVERKLGLQNTQAPEDYEWGDYANELDVENVHLSNLKNKAKELKLSQDAFNNLIDPLVKYQQSLRPNADEEIKKLGEHANARINTLNTWASNNLSDKAIETLGSISQTAEVVELMDEIRQLHFQIQSRVPTGPQTMQQMEIISATSVQDEIVRNYAKYSSDASYRQEMSRKLQQALGDD